MDFHGIFFVFVYTENYGKTILRRHGSTTLMKTVGPSRLIFPYEV